MKKVKMRQNQLKAIDGGGQLIKVKGKLLSLPQSECQYSIECK